MRSRHGSPHPDLAQRAARFAEALDRDDYLSAADLLAASCVYQTRSGQLVGPAAICDSYRKASEWGRRNLDALTFASRVGPARANEVTVVFVDHIVHQGRAHAYRSRQVLRFSAEGTIVRITQHALPGEDEALARFFAAVGLAR